mgnify:CR=1 FL=1
MKKKYFYLSLLLLFLCILSVDSHATNMRKYTSNLKFIPISSSILPTNEVRILYQDSDGYIWLPTYNGLVRYDGYSVVNYGLNDGTNLPFNCYLNVVTEDQDGDLWIAAEKGVFKLHKLTGVIERIGSEKLALIAKHAGNFAVGGLIGPDQLRNVHLGGDELIHLAADTQPGDDRVLPLCVDGRLEDQHPHTALFIVVGDLHQGSGLAAVHCAVPKI